MYHTRIEMTLLSIVAAVALVGQSAAAPAAPKNPADLPITEACSWVVGTNPDLKPLARICEAARSINLPNFVCQVHVERRQPVFSNANVFRRDVVTGETTYRDGKEELSDLRIDGRPATAEDLSGNRQWAEGQFEPPGSGVLEGVSNPVFRFVGSTEEAGRSLLVFDYAVEKDGNHRWVLGYGVTTYVPAFSGKLFVDKSTGLLRRYTREANGLESETPFRVIQQEINYDKVSIAGLGEFVLPVRARFVSCQKESAVCSENVVEYKACRKFAATSKITSY